MCLCTNYALSMRIEMADDDDFCKKKIENTATVGRSMGLGHGEIYLHVCRCDNGETRFFRFSCKQLVRVRNGVRCSDELEITFTGLFTQVNCNFHSVSMKESSLHPFDIRKWH